MESPHGKGDIVAIENEVPEDDEDERTLNQCENCRRGFDPAENADNKCVWHKNRIMVVIKDSPMWSEYDQLELSEGLNKSSFASGYMWECCGTGLENGGCQTTKHKKVEDGILLNPLSSALKAWELFESVVLRPGLRKPTLERKLLEECQRITCEDFFAWFEEEDAEAFSELFRPI